MILLQLYILFYVLFNTCPHRQLVHVCVCVCVQRDSSPPLSRGYFVGALEGPAGSGPLATLKTITLMEELGKICIRVSLIRDAVLTVRQRATCTSQLQCE